MALNGSENNLPGLFIPEQFRAGVASIGTLTDVQFSELLAALKKSLPADTAKDLTTKLASDVPSISARELEDIVGALASMQGVQKTAHVDAPRFASDLWDSLDEDGEESEEIDEEIFKSRMNALLNETSIHLTSIKIAELRREIERMFCSARILTDIRTAFGYDAKKRPALTVMHTLEIKYHDDTGKLREFYVSIDDSDLTILKEAIDRAFEKKATLVDLLEKAKFDLYE